MVVNVWISAVTTDTLSRKDAIAWVNDRLKSHLTKVEEMATGAAYCQLTHMLFRDAISLRKVKFNPRSEPDILNNWKVLTTSWKNIGIDKPVDVEKLKKAKFQDNMEFLQWFFKFYNANNSGDEDYDAVAARGGEDLPALKGPAGVARPAAAAVRPVAPRPTVQTTTRAAAPPVTKAPPKAAAPTTTTTTTQRSSPSQDTALLKEVEVLRRRNAELENEVLEWQENAKELENERDHYYSLLRKVEELLNKSEDDGVKNLEISVIKATLFGEDEAVDENGGGAELQTNGKVDSEVVEEDGETF